MNKERDASSVSDECPFSKKNISRIAFIAFAYFSAHQLAFLFPDSAKILMAVWPAGGIGLATLLLNPRRRWPLILPVLFISGMAADLLAHRGLLLSAGFMTANVLESFGCAWLITRWCGEEVRFTRSKEVLELVMAAVGVNACTAMIGAGSATLVTQAPFLGFWKTWWVADGLGIMLIAPLIVTWAVPLRSFLSRVRWDRLFELGVFTLLWCGFSWMLFGSERHLDSMVLRPYMLVPLVVWLALRFDQGAVMAALFLLTCVALTSAVGKTGYFPWPVEDLAGRLLTVQIFLGVIASTGMLLSAIHTEQQRAEEALKVAHQKLDATLNALPDLLFEVDESGRFYNYRAPKRRNLFAPPEVFLGRSVEQVLPPECARVAMEAIREAAASGSSVGRSYPLFMPEGPKWFELSVAKQESMPGSDKRLIVLARDITERKKADEALRESEARFSKFFHNSPAGMGYSAMLDNKFVDVNEAFAKIFGFTREEIIGHTSAELGLWPVSRQREWVAAEVKKHGRVLGFEAKFRKKSGEVGDLLVSAESIMLTGREHLLGVILPITELKQAEEALQETHKLLSLFIQESPIYAYIAEVTPTQIRILQASRNFRKMPGLICCDVVGKTLTELFPQEFAEKISTDDRRVIASGEVLKVEEEFGGHSYSTIKFPIALSDKTLLAGYTIDITEQKRAQAMLLQLMEAKARFTASVSHELRSPLATIKAATELVREGLAGPVNDQQKDLLDTAQKNIERLGRLINNVLVYQKTQAGKEAFDFQENDLHEVIREAYKSAVLFAGDRSADLVLELAKDLPAMKFDKDKILQVLLNLVSNAVKYSEKGNIVIQTRCEQGGVSVSVRDSGPGIKAGRLEAIFEPFSQAGNDRKGGTGLGLSIAREIVLAHHGRIWAESEEGKGSVFHFTLPL